MKLQTSSNITDSYAKMKGAVLKVKIVGSIMKDHYKKLARMAFLFRNNEGYILKADSAAFESLRLEIESSDSSKCEKSHAKCAAKKRSASSSRNSKELAEEHHWDTIGTYDL